MRSVIVEHNVLNEGASTSKSLPLCVRSEEDVNSRTLQLPKRPRVLTEPLPKGNVTSMHGTDDHISDCTDNPISERRELALTEEPTAAETAFGAFNDPALTTGTKRVAVCSELTSLTYTRIVQC